MRPVEEPTEEIDKKMFWRRCIHLLKLKFFEKSYWDSATDIQVLNEGEWSWKFVWHIRWTDCCIVLGMLQEVTRNLSQSQVGSNARR